MYSYPFKKIFKSYEGFFFAILYKNTFSSSFLIYENFKITPLVVVLDMLVYSSFISYLFYLCSCLTSVLTEKAHHESF